MPISDPNSNTSSEPQSDSGAPNEINLAALSTPDLYIQMGYDLYDGLAEEVTAEVNECLGRGISAYDVMTLGLVAGMEIVGNDFRDGILFVPEVLMAAKAMKAGMAILGPILANTGAPKVGKMVIGTVKGDIHDIGKNLVAMMMEGAGFEVINLGVNCDVAKYVAAIKEHQPDILGMSALLTTTMPYMKTVINGLKSEGLRDKVIVLIGGAPVNAAFAEDIEADAYCRDAAVAVETAKKFVQIRRGAA
jgi:5-methyltetrahydrofolate--homocysteine methyltransferase